VLRMVDRVSLAHIFVVHTLQHYDTIRIARPQTYTAGIRTLPKGSKTHYTPTG
jgi:hypothetical protein